MIQTPAPLLPPHVYPREVAVARLHPEFPLFGIPIRLSPGWLLAIALVVGGIVTLAPPPPDGADPVGRGVTTVLVAALLLGAIFLHELAHALMARWCGVPVRRIALSFFGGVTELDAEATRPRSETLVAVAGPLASLLLSALCGGLWWAGRGLGAAPASGLAALALANLVLATLTLLPGYPLDGGRIVRAGLWYLLDDLIAATRLAALYAQALAWGLILIGIFLLLRNQTAWGVGLLLCGWFLRGEARAGYHRVLWRERSTRLPTIGAAAIQQPRIPADRSLSEAADDVLEGVGGRGERVPSFVVDGAGKPIGLLGIDQLRAVRRAHWATTSARAAMLDLATLPTLAADLPLDRALATCAAGRYSYALVVGPEGSPGGEPPPIGIVTPGGMQRYLARGETGHPERAAPRREAGPSDS